ncbi:MAG: metalloregulator ArsR/SmtB family transcription factor [Pseudomonadota bacterium]
MVEHNVAALDAVFQALADATRRAIVARLASGPEVTVTELSEPFDMSLAAVSKHLRVLERAGVIERRRSGRQHFCRLSRSGLEGADTWLRYYAQFWTERLDELEALLDEEGS